MNIYSCLISYQDLGVGRNCWLWMGFRFSEEAGKRDVKKACLE